MRNARLLFGTLLGTLSIVACSLEHVRVAALDDAGHANPGGELASAGNSSLSASASAGGGTLNAGGAPPQGGDDWFILISGGSNVDLPIPSDASAPSEVVCACLGEGVRLCGSDGISYSCDGGGACLLPAIACLHTCPCLDGESADGNAIAWFSRECAPSTPCQSGLICTMLSNTTPDGTTGCTDAGN
jgi:hypothetical protein